MGRVVAEWAFGPIVLLTEKRRLGEFQPLGDDFEKSVPLIATEGCPLLDLAENRVTTDRPTVCLSVTLA